MNTASDDYRFGPVLWIRPQGEVATQLAAAVRTLAERLGGPCFAPHITLLGSLPGSPEAAAAVLPGLAGPLTPFALKTLGVGLDEAPFRALFLPVPMTAALWQARQIARRYLHPLHEEAYLPHLSLYYGSAPRQERLQALADLTLPPSFRIEVRDIDLVLADGPPEAWRVIRSFPL